MEKDTGSSFFQLPQFCNKRSSYFRAGRKRVTKWPTFNREQPNHWIFRVDSNYCWPSHSGDDMAERKSQTVRNSWSLDSARPEIYEHTWIGSEIWKNFGCWGNRLCRASPYANHKAGFYQAGFKKHHATRWKDNWCQWDIQAFLGHEKFIDWDPLQSARSPEFCKFLSHKIRSWI